MLKGRRSQIRLHDNVWPGTVACAVSGERNIEGAHGPCLWWYTCICFSIIVSKNANILIEKRKKNGPYIHAHHLSC